MSAPIKNGNGNGNGNGINRLGVYASVFMAAVTVVVAFVWVGSIATKVETQAAYLMQISERIGKIEDENPQISQNKNNVTTLTARVAVLETTSKDLLTGVTTNSRDLREIETQCRAIENTRNLMHASDLRTIAQLWEKAFNLRMPTDNAFYPDICRVNG